MSDEQQQEHQEVAPPSFEEEAQAQGWVPKEKYRGDEADWVDAETFVRRGREILPIVRKNNERLLKELKEAKDAAEEARSAAREFKQFQKEQYERKAKELEAQVDQLKQAKRDAISSGDGDRVLAIDDALDDIKEQRQEAKQAVKEAEAAAREAEKAPQTLDPALNNWLGKNEWFGTDTRLTGIANGIGEAIRKETGLQGQAFLDRLDEELAQYVPDKFGKKRTPNPMDSAPAGNRPTPKGKRSYDALPSDAKAACDKFVKQGLMTKEEYVQSYDWE